MNNGNNKYDFSELNEKYHKGLCSEEEKAVVESWLIAQLKKEVTMPSANEVEKADQRMRAVVQKHINAMDGKVIRLWRPVAAAAIAVIIFGAGLFYYNIKNSKDNYPISQQSANDISPGKQGATLTLSSGKKIRLADMQNGQFEEAGTIITKSTKGELVYEIKSADDGVGGRTNTLSTANGETYSVRLPDGTLVHLNSASTLTYPTNIKAYAKRIVELRGEAFFQVAKDKAHPFLVRSANQEVEVLGTAFNITSYADDPLVKTTLLEGVINITNLTAAEGTAMRNVLLQPGHQAVLGASNQFVVQQVDPNEAIAWKNGKFVFDNEDLGNIMRRLARWYNVEIVYQGDVRQRTFTGSISRHEHISSVLEKISYTQDVHFNIEGRRITVMP